VSYNKYESYSTAFDRNIAWADKSDAFSKVESKSKEKKQ
jgi:hypothetical protein